MATPAITPQAGAAPQQGAAPASPSGGGGGEALKMLAAITRLAQAIAQQSSATSPDMEQISASVQSAMRKLVMQSQGGAQQAPPF